MVECCLNFNWLRLASVIITGLESQRYFIVRQKFKNTYVQVYVCTIWFRRFFQCNAPNILSLYVCFCSLGSFELRKRWIVLFLCLFLCFLVKFRYVVRNCSVAWSAHSSNYYVQHILDLFTLAQNPRRLRFIETRLNFFITFRTMESHQQWNLIW